MTPTQLRLFLAAVVLGALSWLGFRGAGRLPPLGPFLDPANGIWALARTAEFPRRSEARIPGLAAPVQVSYDDRGVPHVFAENEEDAWRAQGYLLARDRLFQMELQTRSASGTLSELLGAQALEPDRATRRRGFPWAAGRNFGALDSSSLFFRAASAYADGVNAWIDGLGRADLPLEYRLLNAQPVRWEPVNSYYLFLQMSFVLAWFEPTLAKLEARALVGANAADALFPANSPIQEPIQPNGQHSARYDFIPLAAPGPPDTSALAALQERTAMDVGLGFGSRPFRESVATGESGDPTFGNGDALGSNNWVVSPRRTAAGHALLAGDPHLDLSLPSVWYEIHLQTAGGPEVAGVTFPGSPGVIIGFNRDVAWSFTNTGADVRDHYRETVDDPARPTRYLLDGQWKPLELRQEVVRGRRGAILATDTVRFTHRGPLLSVQGRWLSLRWTPYEARSTGEEFLRLDRARNAAEWLDGWKDFVAPAQNGIVADRSGTIAIRSTASIPLRPGGGLGDLVRDGSTASNDWTGFLPLAQYPFALNPAQGYLASANQQPVDPRVNRVYLGTDWPSPWRAMRINQLLRADSAVTPGAMRRFQTDPGSSRADAFVPYFVAALTPAGTGPTVSAAQLLAGWDRRYTKDNTGAVLFEAALAELSPLLWDELIPPAAPDRSVARPPATNRPVAVPGDAVLLQLLADSTNAWWDDRRTPEVERRDAMLAEALRRGFDATARRHGPPGEAWRWDRVHHANIWHLLRIPALSALELPVTGGPSTLSPSPGSGTHGASWRMVVELGPRVHGAAIYPGGQSGNPASARYDDRMPKWLAGELDSVLFPARPEDLPASRVRSTLILSPPR